jgi:hypothetical protein
MLNVNIIEDIKLIMIIVVTIIGVIKFKNISSIYYYYIITRVFACLEMFLIPFFIGDVHMQGFIYNVFYLFHDVLIFLFFTIQHLKKQNKNMFLVVLFIIILLDTLNILINFSKNGYANNYLNYIVQFILVFVLINRLNPIKGNNDIIYKINNSELLILIPKLIFILFDILLGILIVFVFNNQTKNLFHNFNIIIIFIAICSNILAVIALIIAPKREKYA